MIAEIFSETGLIVVALVALVLFGGNKLPEFARSLGRAKREFERGSTDGATESTADVPASEDEQHDRPDA